MDSNRGLSAYQPNALPLGQTGSRTTMRAACNFKLPHPLHPPTPNTHFQLLAQPTGGMGLRLFTGERRWRANIFASAALK